MSSRKRASLLVSTGISAWAHEGDETRNGKMKGSKVSHMQVVVCTLVRMLSHRGFAALFWSYQEKRPAKDADKTRP